MHLQDIEIPQYIQALTKRTADLEQLVHDYIELAEALPLWKYKDDIREEVEVKWRVRRQVLKDRARTLGHIIREEKSNGVKDNNNRS